MQIRQLPLANDQHQARLLLRIATQANEEIRIWITRRFLRNIWPHLAERVDTKPLPPQADDDKPRAKPENTTSFEQPFREDNAVYPLGMTPMLASELSYEPLKEGGLKLTFREGRERRISFHFTPDLIEAMLSMLRAGAEKLKWDLTLDYSAKANAPELPPVAPGVPPSRLH